MLLTGDIMPSLRLPAWVKLVGRVGVPVFSVLGNHDYYGGSFESLAMSLSRVANVAQGAPALAAVDS